MNEKNEVCLDWTILESVDITKEKRLGDAPMSFYKACNNSRFWDSSFDFQVISEEGISTPILQGTPIASLVSAQKMYDTLYAYISSLNDIEFSDTRTDVHKAMGDDCDSALMFWDGKSKGTQQNMDYLNELDKYYLVVTGDSLGVGNIHNMIML